MFWEYLFLQLRTMAIFFKLQKYRSSLDVEFFGAYWLVCCSLYEVGTVKEKLQQN